MTTDAALADYETIAAKTPPPAGSLRNKVVLGALWTVIGYGASFVLRFGSSLILSRLLFPEAFGLSTIVGIWLGGLQMFSDIGVGTSIVRSARGGDRRFLDTAWSIQAARGIVLWLGSIVLAWPLAMCYGQRELLWLIPVSGFTAVIQGFNATTLSTATRELALKRLVLLEIATQVVTLLTNVMVALIYPSVWALVVGNLVGTLLRMVASHLVLEGHRHAFAWEPETIRELFGFGRWVFVSTMVTFLAMTGDRIVLGRLISLSEFGLYSLAFTLANVPFDLFQRLTTQLALPMMARVWRENGGLAKVSTARSALLTIGAVMIAPLIGVGQTAVEFLFDPRYHGAGRFVAVLTGVVWLQAVTASHGCVLLALGKPKAIGLGVATRAVVFFLLVAPVFHEFGAIGVAALAGASEVGAQLICMLAVRREGLPTFRLDVLTHLLFALTAATTYLACGALMDLTGSRVASLTILGATGSLVLAAAGWYTFRHHLALFRRAGAES